MTNFCPSNLVLSSCSSYAALLFHHPSWFSFLSSFLSSLPPLLVLLSTFNSHLFPSIVLFDFPSSLFDLPLSVFYPGLLLPLSMTPFPLVSSIHPCLSFSSPKLFVSSLPSLSFTCHLLHSLSRTLISRHYSKYNVSFDCITFSVWISKMRVTEQVLGGGLSRANTEYTSRPSSTQCVAMATAAEKPAHSKGGPISVALPLQGPWLTELLQKGTINHIHSLPISSCLPSLFCTAFLFQIVFV